MDTSLLVLVMVGAAAAAAGAFFRRSRASSLPKQSDDAFVAHFLEKAPGLKAGLILRERSYIAKVLGVPVDRVTPGLTYPEIAKHFFHHPDLSVAWSDLEYEAQELAGEANIDCPVDAIASIEGLVETFVRAKTLIDRSE